MVISTADAQALITHAGKHDKVVSVAFPGPFSCEFQYIRDLIARGDLGDIYMISGLCAQDWLANIGGTWRTTLALSGGGNLYDSGAHMFNAMLYLTGLSATEVFAFIENKDQEVDVVGTVAMRFTKGALGSAAVSGATTVFEQGLYIHGTKGSVKCSIYGGSMEIWLGPNQVKYPAVPETVSLQQNCEISSASISGSAVFACFSPFAVKSLLAVRARAKTCLACVPNAECRMLVPTVVTIH